MQWSGVQPGSLLPLEGILQSWVETNRRIVKSWFPDVPWQYNERTSLSTLAGAVWRKGGFAIEEFTTEKRPLKSPSFKLRATDGRYGWGRCDLYFELGDIECEVEAKFCRPLIDKTADHQKVLARHLEVAVRDASRNRKYDDRLHIGLLIATPVISYDTLATKNDIFLRWEAYLGRWIDAAKNMPESAAAWFFPKDLPFTRFVNSPKSEHFFPGVVMLLSQPEPDQANSAFENGRSQASLRSVARAVQRGR